MTEVLVLLLLLLACRPEEPALADGPSHQVKPYTPPVGAAPVEPRPEGALVTDWTQSSRGDAVYAGAHGLEGVFTMGTWLCGVGATPSGGGWDVAMGGHPRSLDQSADGDAVAITDAGVFRVVDPQGGAVLRRDLGVADAVAARFDDRDLLVLRAVDEGCRLDRFDERGDLLATEPVPTGVCETGALAVADGAVYMLDGVELWRNDRALATVEGDRLAVRDGVVLVGALGGAEVAAFDAVRGDPLWSRALDGALVDLALGGEPTLAYTLTEAKGALGLRAWHARDAADFAHLAFPAAAPFGMGVFSSSGRVLLLNGGEINSFKVTLDL